MTVQNSSSVKVVSNFGNSSEVEEYVIEPNTSTQELICHILRRHGMTSRDPNLFYLTLEGWNNGEAIKDTITVYNDSRPLMLQTANQNCRFLMHMRAGGLVKIFDSCIMSGSHYKSLFISKKTATRDVIGLLLSSYQMKESVDNFILVEKRGEDERLLKPYDYPLIIYQSGNQSELHLRRINNITVQKKLEQGIPTSQLTKKPSVKSVYETKEVDKEKKSDLSRDSTTINRLKESFKWLQKKRTGGTPNGLNHSKPDASESKGLENSNQAVSNKLKMDNFRPELLVEEETKFTSGNNGRITSDKFDPDVLNYHKLSNEDSLSVKNVPIPVDSHFIYPVPYAASNQSELREAPSHIPVYIRHQVPQIHNFDRNELDINGNHTSELSLQDSIQSAREFRTKDFDKVKYHRQPNSARAPFQRNNLTKSYRPHKPSVPPDTSVSSLRRSNSLRITNTQEQPPKTYRQSMIEASASSKVVSMNGTEDVTQNGNDISSSPSKKTTQKNFNFRVANRDNNAITTRRANSRKHETDSFSMTGHSMTSFSHNGFTHKNGDRNSPAPHIMVDNDRSIDTPDLTKIKGSYHTVDTTPKHDFITNTNDEISQQSQTTTGYSTIDSERTFPSSYDHTRTLTPESLMSLPSPKDDCEHFIPMDHDSAISTVVRRHKRKPNDGATSQSGFSKLGPTKTTNDRLLRRNSSLSNYKQNFVSGWMTKISSGTQTLDPPIMPSEKKSPTYPSLFDIARCCRIFHITLVRSSKWDRLGFSCVESKFANPQASLHPLPCGRRPKTLSSDFSRESAFRKLSSTGSDCQHKSIITVDLVSPGSLSDNNFQSGDLLLEINGESVIGESIDRVKLMLNSHPVLEILAARMWTNHNGDVIRKNKSLNHKEKDKRNAPTELDDLRTRIGQLEQEIQIKDRLLAELQTVLSKRVKLRQIPSNKSDELLNIHNCFAIIKSQV